MRLEHNVLCYRPARFREQLPQPGVDDLSDALGEAGSPRDVHREERLHERQRPLTESPVRHGKTQPLSGQDLASRQADNEH